MHITLDNMFAFLVLLLILVTFMGYIIPTAYLSFTTTREHQLEEIAQAIVDKMLLSPGIPEDWGDIQLVRTENDLKAFGLQKVNGSFYELDVNKVLRIASVNTSTTKTLPQTVRISQDTIARLLGLGNEYGFSIRITPALNISLKVLEEHCIKETGQKCKHSVPSRIRVTVMTPEGRPALGANVTGLYILVTLEKDPSNHSQVVSNYTWFSEKGVTNWKGEAELEFGNLLEMVKKENRNLNNETCSALVVYADYYGIRATTSSLLNSTFYDVINGTIIENYLIVKFEESVWIPPGARKTAPEVGLTDPPYYIYISRFENLTEQGSSGVIINHGNFKIRVYGISNVVDDDVSLIMLPVSVPIPQQGRKYVLVNFYRVPNIICQKGAASGNIKTSVLRRIVKVGSFHYVFEVRVWRWGE
ncbi:MAG: hypothetical protein QW506_03635 [Thermoproteota archaeon]